MNEIRLLPRSLPDSLTGASGSLRMLVQSLTTLSLLVALGFPSMTRAEVGVALPGGGPANTYILRSIVDDPEPIGGAWQRFAQDGAARKILNDQGHANGDGNPSLAVAPVGGGPIVVWSRNSPAGYDVVASRFSGGSWSAPVVVAASPADELDPSVAIDPVGGGVHILYWIADAAPRVMHRQVSADLSSFGPEEVVSQPGEVACRPSAAFHAGTLRVAYEVHDFGYGTTPRRIVLAEQTPEGYDAESLTLTYYSGQAWPQVHASGAALWIDWIDAVGEACWLRQSTPGIWDPAQIETFSGPEERDIHVRGEIRIHVTQ